jgi:4-amino-4-deoxy-L-arabinose transferase-like glycosyltransferase
MSGANPPARVRRLLLGGALLAYAVIGFGGLNPYLPGGGDNAEYIAQAEALATLGHRADLHMAGAPTELLKPPLFPALLAGVHQLCGRNVIAFKALVVLFGLGAVWAAWWALEAARRDEETPLPAAADPSPAGLALWFALTPTLGLYSHDVLSDVPFAFVALLAFGCAAWAVRPGITTKRAWAFLFALVGLLAVATLLRAAGLILACACAGYLLLEALLRRRAEDSRRRWLQAALVALATVAIFLWLRRGQHTYFSADQLYREATTPEVAGLTERLGRSFHFYATFLGVEVAGYPGFSPANLPWIVALPLLLVGWVTLLRRGQRLVPVCWLLYQGAVLAWPFLDTRFYLPVLPFFLCLLWVGVRTILESVCRLSLHGGLLLVYALCLCPVVALIGALFDFGQVETTSTFWPEWLVAAGLLALLLLLVVRASPAKSARLAPLLKTLVVVVLLLACVRGLSENLVREHLWGPAPAPALGWARGWREFYAAAAWLKEHARPGDVVVSAKPSLVWFWTGLQGVGVPPTTDQAAVLGRIKQAQWALVDDLREDAAAPRYLLPALRRRREWPVIWLAPLESDEELETPRALVFRHREAPQNEQTVPPQ